MNSRKSGPIESGRRRFLKGSAAALGVAALEGVRPAAAPDDLPDDKLIEGGEIHQHG